MGKMYPVSKNDKPPHTSSVKRKKRKNKAEEERNPSNPQNFVLPCIKDMRNLSYNFRNRYFMIENKK